MRTIKLLGIAVLFASIGITYGTGFAAGQTDAESARVKGINDWTELKSKQENAVKNLLTSALKTANGEAFRASVQDLNGGIIHEEMADYHHTEMLKARVRAIGTMWGLSSAEIAHRLAALDRIHRLRTVYLYGHMLPRDLNNLNGSAILPVYVTKEEMDSLIAAAAEETQLPKLEIFK